MSSAPSTSFNPVKIALTATGVLAAATVGYAVYFDYRRRNDSVFRKKLLKEHKKVDKKVKHQQESGKAQIQTALRRAIQIANAEPVPETAEGKEQFFMEQVALGEQLAARSPEFYVASAISFYKALKVYPAPQELIMIYQKTQPPAVFDLVMELISMEINEAASSRGASSSSSGGPPRSSDPILQELEEGEQGENQAEKSVEQEEEIQVNKGPSSTASTEGDDLSNVSPPSGSGSFVHVETDTKEGEAVKAEVGVNAQDPPEEPLA